jgi:F-type H+-transporting ATPase subunit a
MTPRRNSAGKSRTQRTGGPRFGPALAALGLGCLLVLTPVIAQEHAPEAPRANAPAAAPHGNEPAPHGNAPAHAPATPGEPHGAQEGGHGDEAHGDGHAEEHGEGAQAISIHLNTWMTALLKRVWYSGPATLNVEGALGPDGQPIPADQLRGKAVEYVWEDHHAHPPKEYHVDATIGQVGTSESGGKTAQVAVDGRQVTLINPSDPVFLYQQMFPEGIVASLLTALTIGIVAVLLTRRLRRVPTRTQAALELIYEGLHSFVRDLIGPHYRRYFPLVATLFFYIVFMNWAGLIPGWISPTANINVTAGLAVSIVLFVQYEGIRANGFIGYLKHFAGEPWWLAPMNFPLHIIGEAARVLSLTLRLFGNIFGEDVVIVILLFLGVMFTGFLPFQAPMVLFAVFTGFVQALVFTILTCIYLSLATSHAHHDAHEEDHGHAQHAAAPAHA